MVFKVFCFFFFASTSYEHKNQVLSEETHPHATLELIAPNCLVVVCTLH